MPKSHTSGISTAEKTLRAIELRRDGKSFEAIGQDLGCNRSYACRLVQKELKRLAAETMQNSEELRALENKRLDYLLEKLEDRVKTADLSAINTYLRISERRSKLNGLDGPQAIEHSGGISISLQLQDCSKKEDMCNITPVTRNSSKRLQGPNG